MEEARYSSEHKVVLDSILLAMPGVTVGQAFGYPAYKVQGKVFAFVGGPGMGLKLPAARVQELLQSHEDMVPFEPAAGIVWKNWIAIHPPDPAAYEVHEPLFIESVQYVSGG